MSKKYAYEEVKHYIEIESGSECKLLSKEYTNANANLKISCKCSNEFIITFSGFKNGRKKQMCNDCTNEKMNKKFKQDYYEVSSYVENNSNCKLISTEYINSHEKLKFKCLCENEFETTFDKFKNRNKRQCNECGNKITGSKLTMSNDEFATRFDDINTNNEYDLLSKYVSSDKKVSILHKTCGNMLLVNPHTFTKGHKCIHCFGNIKKTTDEFKKEIYNLVQNEYEVLGEYKNNKTKIKIKHNCTNCNNHIYYVSPIKFINGNRCPSCNLSKGEKMVLNYLQVNNIKYVEEFVFSDLKGKYNPLRFDFAIFDTNNKLKCLIEYDGEFHFEDVYRDGRLKKQQKYDKLKNEYCKDKNIHLIRIPYWQQNKINSILCKWMNKYNLSMKQENLKEVI